MSTETPKEAPKPSPDAAREVADRTKNFLEKLKTDVEAIADDEGKKTLIRERLQGMEKKDLDALKQNIDQNLISPDLLNALIGIRDLVEEKRNALKAEVEATRGAAEQKPEGWMAQAGDTLKKGAETVIGWMKSFGAWTSEKAGGGWKHFVEGATATIAAIGSGWAWLREKSAHAFGSLAASVDDYLPDWIKKPLNFLMGDFGVIYKNFSRYRIEVTPNTPDQEMSLAAFMEKYRALSDNDKGGSFDGFCKAVALNVRANRTGPLTVKQSELELAADQVVAQKMAAPAVPSVTSAVAPAAPSQPPTPEHITRTEVQSFTINGIDISKITEKNETLLKMNDRKYRVNVGVPVSVTKIEELSDGNVAFTGKASALIPGTITVTKQELGNVANAVITGKKTLEVTYRNGAGVEKKQKMTFEVVPSV
ncbi:MAG: hypothetical protein PHX87_04890 [Candidatus Peribacteraceae bacterium]|nr:hypothetical protein [Candidatus Peribacteraceae bacterium]MDD5742732.1 hypothetical protein [Candidatus Peribacteraceae bacterium]